MVEQLTYADLETLAKHYLEWHVFPEFANIILDVLGSVATPDTQTLLTNIVFLAEKPNADHILRTLVHFVGLKDSPPEVSFYCYL